MYSLPLPGKDLETKRNGWGWTSRDPSLPPIGLITELTMKIYLRGRINKPVSRLARGTSSGYPMTAPHGVGAGAWRKYWLFDATQRSAHTVYWFSTVWVSPPVWGAVF